MVRQTKLSGERHEILYDDKRYPPMFRNLAHSPECLYVIGDPVALSEGLAVVGARKATPYGLSCARRFASIAASMGITVISGGARGCDGAAHRAALEEKGRTVVFLGGGCDQIYPKEHVSLFQQVVDGGGAVVSEHPWAFPPVSFAFRERNRLIAALARATLIVEAGLPSGTFSTADEALAMGREILVVPGAITSKTSLGSNRLLHQGATPIIDDQTFKDTMLMLFGSCCTDDEEAETLALRATSPEELLLPAIQAQPLSVEALHNLIKSCCAYKDSLGWLMTWLTTAERDGLIARYPDGRYGPVLPAKAN